MPQEQIDELIKGQRIQQEKFVYYKMALSVGAIAYSLQISYKDLTQSSDILLLIAVCLWSISTFFGLKHIRYALSIIHNNIEYLYMSDGLYEYQKVPENKIPEYKEIIQSGMNKKSEKALQFFIWQERLIYVGMIQFIIWFILKSAAIF